MLYTVIKFEILAKYEKSLIIFIKKYNLSRYYRM